MPRSFFTSAAALAFLGCIAAGAAGGAPAEPDAIAILSSRCLSCHNAEKRAGGIDLGSSRHAAAVLAGGARSRLMQAVSSGRMPPQGAKLRREELAAMRTWLERGAPYPATPLKPAAPVQGPLWSLQPVRRLDPPSTGFDRLAANPIDRFIFQKLGQEGLTPSPPAPRRELIRRLSFVLTGLPPTAEQVASFLADRSPDAYRRLVDRFLASPGYGERWARHWLDVARYGDSHGYEQNHLRPNAWPYRDYVIRFFNEDRPFTDFVTEQLAGDVAAAGDPQREVATGFIVAGVHDTVGNQSEEGRRQQRTNDLDDMVSTTAEAFLGLTAGCARCHDHKFDPVPQRDYYRLAAVFAGFQHGERPAGRKAEASGERADGRLESEISLVELRQAELDEQVRRRLLQQQSLPVSRRAVHPRLNWDDWEPRRARFVRFVIRKTSDGAQPCIDEFALYGPDSDRNLALGARPSASSLLPGFSIHQIEHLTDGKRGNDHSWISAEPGGGWAQLELPQPELVSRLVWSRDGGTPSRFTDRLPVEYEILLSLDGKEWQEAASHQGRAAAAEAIPAAKLQQGRTDQEREEWRRLESRREELRREAEERAGGARVYAGVITAPEPVYLLRRGDVMQRQEEVAPGPLTQIPGLPAEFPRQGGDSGERRLQLARWITDERNPLTARVLVNRVWQHYFGQGLVSTPSDFGRNGAPPSHPELLDWLAHDFMKNGWRLKRLHRMLAGSYLFRQSSRSNPLGLKRDAGNRLLWRMPLRRVEGEALRDAVLQASGRLDRKMGGPGYRLFDYRVVNVAIYGPLADESPETWRRGIYRQAARGIREELLGSFDCPESSQRTPRRVFTTTPLQALALLNSPFIVTQSRLLAERAARAAGPDQAAAVRQAYRFALGRSPADEELRAALELVDADGLPSLCRALLNSNEFLFY